MNYIIKIRTVESQKKAAKEHKNKMHILVAMRLKNLYEFLNVRNQSIQHNQ